MIEYYWSNLKNGSSGIVSFANLSYRWVCLYWKEPTCGIIIGNCVGGMKSIKGTIAGGSWIWNNNLG